MTDERTERARLVKLISALALCDADLRAVRRLALVYDEALEHLLDAEACRRIRHVHPGIHAAEGSAWMALHAAARRLRTSARELQALCCGPLDEDLARWCTGCVALGAEVDRGLLADPRRELDFDRLGAILTGLNLLARRIGAAGQAYAAHHAAQHRKDVAAWRVAGRHELADQLEDDPVMRACVAALEAAAGQSGQPDDLRRIAAAPSTQLF